MALAHARSCRARPNSARQGRSRPQTIRREGPQRRQRFVRWPKLPSTTLRSQRTCGTFDGLRRLLGRGRDCRRTTYQRHCALYARVSPKTALPHAPSPLYHHRTNTTPPPAPAGPRRWTRSQGRHSPTQAQSRLRGRPRFCRRCGPGYFWRHSSGVNTTSTTRTCGLFRRRGVRSCSASSCG